MALINIENKDGQLVVGSRQIAAHFGKEHSDVVYAIEGRTCSCDGAGCGKCSGRGYQQLGILEVSDKSQTSHMFIKSIYKDGMNRNQKEYLLTRDGFSLLVMGFTGRKALEWKLKYIEAFNRMERQLKAGPMSIDLIIATAQELKALELKQIEQDKQLTSLAEEQKVIRGKVDILNDKEFTVMGYANLHGVPVNNKVANHLGRKASKLSREKGYPVGTATHPVFGRVNTYHIDILDRIFDEWDQ